MTSVRKDAMADIFSSKINDLYGCCNYSAP